MGWFGGDASSLSLGRRPAPLRRTAEATALLSESILIVAEAAGPAAAKCAQACAYKVNALPPDAVLLLI